MSWTSRLLLERKAPPPLLSAPRAEKPTGLLSPSPGAPEESEGSLAIWRRFPRGEPAPEEGTHVAGRMRPSIGTMALPAAISFESVLAARAPLRAISSQRSAPPPLTLPRKGGRGGRGCGRSLTAEC